MAGHDYRSRVRGALGAAGLVVSVALPAGFCAVSAVAQGGFSMGVEVGGPTGDMQAPLLTLDQERLFSETLYGQRLVSEFDRISVALAERNRVISTELAEEERSLTEQRADLPAAEFRELADAFDEKVTTLRAEQDARIRSLQRLRERERRTFSQRVLPILLELLRESNAVAILDDRALVLAVEQVDVTDEAIARIDAAIGDGKTPEDDAMEDALQQELEAVDPETDDLPDPTALSLPEPPEE
ncbi:Skp family chaperone for outer membrane proteins [Aliiruegeria haliotis]|uniref:Skp family chaperone for outer membrane proteins n=1 Tax=Aliiruegeria haliotis TaxID=1280846 RepID=A0A2T0RZP7_9RHOB|nr:OmpH family outer membrane protein [Aliiruegeria haliotis]PRY26649.1 Skp family chaperone for outer membrane proteins [Aliiruegeria haliotis]